MTVVTVIRFVTNPGKNLLARRPHGSVKQSHGASEFKQMTKGFVELVHEIEAEPVEDASDSGVHRSALLGRTRGYCNWAVACRDRFSLIGCFSLFFFFHFQF